MSTIRQRATAATAGPTRSVKVSASARKPDLECGRLMNPGAKVRDITKGRRALPFSTLEQWRELILFEGFYLKNDEKQKLGARYYPRRRFGDCAARILADRMA